MKTNFPRIPRFYYSHRLRKNFEEQLPFVAFQTIIRTSFFLPTFNVFEYRATAHPLKNDFIYSATAKGCVLKGNIYEIFFKSYSEGNVISVNCIVSPERLTHGISSKKIIISFEIHRSANRNGVPFYSDLRQEFP